MQPEPKSWTPPTQEAGPPKFVPTLTEVVPAPLRSTQSANGRATGRMPAPTLTAPSAPPVQTTPESSSQVSPNLPARLDELALVARVMQDIDLHLDAHLRQAVQQLVSEHMSRLLPVLRNEIENKVHDAVRSALVKQMD